MLIWRKSLRGLISVCEDVCLNLVEDCAPIKFLRSRSHPRVLFLYVETWESRPKPCPWFHKHISGWNQYAQEAQSDSLLIFFDRGLVGLKHLSQTPENSTSLFSGGPSIGGFWCCSLVVGGRKWSSKVVMNQLNVYFNEQLN